ncbi:MAG: methyltransferase domain-containing protein [Oscillospiraceae bacterium]|jgi:tRNA (cmo5U34)-methyltransferase|nr:methyltransferase domain-containing protein [Oscillospiraceae bacterium]
MPALEEMSAFFNGRAPQYDRVHTGHIGGGIESKRVIASFLPARTKTLVDLGIGTGLELEAILQRFPGIEITGFDIAENMLRLLGEKYPSQKIRLLCENYLEYDLGDGLYDAALSVMTLHHYTHDVKTALYRKIRRCVRPGGVYIECDYMLSENDCEDAQKQEDMHFAEYERLKNEQGITDNREYHYDTPCTVTNQIKMLCAAGFTGVRKIWQTGNTVILIARK